MSVYESYSAGVQSVIFTIFRINGAFYLEYFLYLFNENLSFYKYKV